MSTVLLVIDIQNDYFPGGRMELEGSIDASLHAKELLTHFRAKNLPVVHVQHVSTRQGATFFIPDTTGIDIHENVRPLPGEIVVMKHSPNSFRDTSLLDHLRGLGADHVVIAGMMTHMCVDATTRAAFDLGLQCTVVSDACATRALTFETTVVPAAHVHAAFLAALSAVYARVVNGNALL